MFGRKRKRFRYRVIARRETSPDGISYCGYGIRVLIRERDGTRHVVEVRDLSDRARTVRAFVRRCNRLRLEPVHLPDVVEDFLAGGDRREKPRRSLRRFPGK